MSVAPILHVPLGGFIYTPKSVSIKLHFIYLALSNMDRDTATAKANYCGPGIYGIYTQRPDHNTGNYVPYSLRTVSEFFNVPQSYLQIRFERRGLRFIVLIRED